MKLALFSHQITKKHEEKLKTFFDKPLKDVKFLYITTPTNYKPYQPDWSVESENRLREIFPLLRQFDLERAFKVDTDFNFKEYLSSFDFIFISGGNTFILSYWMDKTGAREIIKDLVINKKTVYGGESAGTVFTYRNLVPYAMADDPSIAPSRVNEGLGFVNFAPIPHWGNTEFQHTLLEIQQGFTDQNIKTLTIDDNQGVFINDEMVEII